MTRRRGKQGTTEPEAAERQGRPGGGAPRPRPVRRTIAVTLAVCALALVPTGGAAAAPGSSAEKEATEKEATEKEAAEKKAAEKEIAPAVRSGGELPGGLHGPVVTHPVQQPVDYPAGEVCPFAAHAEFPVNDLTMRTWYDDEGRPVFATESGPLVMDVTNLATGRSVTRDISGSGAVTYLDDGSHILSGGDWGVGFHTADRPVHNKWIISRGSMSVRIGEEDGKTTRTLLDLRGPYENLCETLGGKGDAGRDGGNGR